ncbi:hypothetical protein PALB_24670 [Pseudoalteromonas luteoviolacea B = ATCC 29581]|nr:hypothetical protein PALB_24670 [Pseudoalteromonas luteoviolacea B = ATCC 29581]
MIYVILTIVLSLVGLITFLPKYRPLLERYQLGINFILTLVATLVGVLLAIVITEYEVQEKEREDMVKLLGSSIVSVKTCQSYSEDLVEYFDQLPKGETSKVEFFNKNPIPYPDYLDLFLMQDIVGQNISTSTLEELTELMINLKRTRDGKERHYLVILHQIHQLLLAEVEYQKGNIDELRLEQQIEMLNKAYVKAINELD